MQRYNIRVRMCDAEKCYCGFCAQQRCPPTTFIGLGSVSFSAKFCRQTPQSQFFPTRLASLYSIYYFLQSSQSFSCFICCLLYQSGTLPVTIFCYIYFFLILQFFFAYSGCFFSVRLELFPLYSLLIQSVCTFITSQVTPVRAHRLQTL